VVLGREKDMINRGGEKISAEEVEDLVYRMGNIDLVAAVAVPDPVLGERLAICVVPKHGTTAPSLDAVRKHFEVSGVAAFKFPERLEVVPEIPMTKVGKIDKRALRAVMSATDNTPVRS
jgi:2,3-dihydroxybenzoate-AMP ligase